MNPEPCAVCRGTGRRESVDCTVICECQLRNGRPPRPEPPFIVKDRRFQLNPAYRGPLDTALRMMQVAINAAYMHAPVTAAKRCAEAIELLHQAEAERARIVAEPEEGNQ